MSFKQKESEKCLDTAKNTEVNHSKSAGSFFPQIQGQGPNGANDED